MTQPTDEAAVPRAAHDSFDALLPGQMAVRGVEIGSRKAAMGAVPMFVLAVLAGAFIALGAVFALTVGSGAATVTGPDGGLVATVALPFGITRIITGLAFSLGLILVVVAGAELFTGNVLIVMAWASRSVSSRRMLRNWGIVYAGNFVGSIGTAALVVLGGWYKFGGGSVGATALTTASAKVAHTFPEAFYLGILCNILVCLAVWLTYSARSTTDRILAIVPPVAAFVAMGFEHSIANLFFIPVAIAIRAVAPPEFWTAAHLDPNAFASVDVAGLVTNQVPVLLGNVVGGAVFVAAVYWLVFLRGSPATSKTAS
jgi:formate transporter